MMNSKIPIVASFSAVSTRYYHSSVCVIGGGLAGLATAAFFADCNWNVSVIDRHGPGMSSVEVGLLHPTTPKGKLIWQGAQGMETTLDLVRRASLHGYKVMNSGCRIVRPIQDSKVLNRYKSFRNDNEILDILSTDEYLKFIPGGNSDVVGAVLLKQSAVINVRNYLKGLWTEVQTTAPFSEWISTDVTSIEALVSQYDAVVVAAGPSSGNLWGVGSGEALRLRQKRGSVISCTDTRAATTSGEDTYFSHPLRKHSISHLEHAILTGPYIIPHPCLPGVVVCGATKEVEVGGSAEGGDSCSKDSGNDSGRDSSGVKFTRAARDCMDSNIDNNAVWDELKESLIDMYPAIANNTEVVGQWSGYRVYCDRGKGKPKLPVVCRHNTHKGAWLIGGFGSRGLIHHGIAARYLVDAVCKGDENSIPLELRIV